MQTQEQKLREEWHARTVNMAQAVLEEQGRILSLIRNTDKLDHFCELINLEKECSKISRNKSHRRMGQSSRILIKPN